jgi:hypothetical protein
MFLQKSCDLLAIHLGFLLCLSLYISVNGAFFQCSIHCDHMAPEHIVVFIPGGKTTAGRYCKLGEEDAPGELILGDGVFLRVSVGLIIIRQPFVGLSSELLGSYRSQGLIPGFLVCQQFLHHIGDTGPGCFLFNLYIQ